MTTDGGREFEVVRDPLWDNIRLDGAALAVLDTPAVQRLRYVRQLGHAFLVYPGATHTRFEHALGAYHLARRALSVLAERGDLAAIDPTDLVAVPLAALLHDIGHYPFSHALEEAGFTSHETLGAARLGAPPLRQVLHQLGGPELAGRIAALIQGRSASPLQGLISGTLDLDKIDYLSRDARMCGVPYGVLDVDRLLASLTLVEGPGGPEIGIHEKGVSALESLLFAKYQMYRNVYWHHAVRSATCMFKRAVRDAVAGGFVAEAELPEFTDDAFMQRLVTEGSPLAQALRARRLCKRALDIPAGEIPGGPHTDLAPGWTVTDPDLLARVEDQVAREAGLAPGEVLIDFPARARMLSVDLRLRLRSGGVEHLTDEGLTGQLGLPRIAAQLYQAARRLRVFVARPPNRPLDAVGTLPGRPPDEIRDRLAREALLG